MVARLLHAGSPRLRGSRAALLCAALLCAAAAPLLAPPKQPLPPRPWVIAHRGASGLLPEHTLASYELAIQQGAAIIECDIVLTKDCALVCRHEPLLSNTTDADERFPGRSATHEIDGKVFKGVFAKDLTLAEVRGLRARQAFSGRSRAADGAHGVPTLGEFLRLAGDAARIVGVEPELKHSAWHDGLGLACLANTTMARVVLQAMEAHGYTGAPGTPAWAARPAYLQSFEPATLRWLAARTRLPLLQLVERGAQPVPGDGRPSSALLTPAGLAEVAAYAAAIGPSKVDMLRAQPGEPAHDLVRRAHAAGLEVQPFTFRDDAGQQDARWRGRPADEARHFLALGVDAAFTDFPGTWAPLVAGHQADAAHVARDGRRRRQRLEDAQEM